MRNAAKLAAQATGGVLIAVILALTMAAVAVRIIDQDSETSPALFSILISTAACGGIGTVLGLLS